MVSADRPVDSAGNPNYTKYAAYIYTETPKCTSDYIPVQFPVQLPFLVAYAYSLSVASP